MEFLQIIFWIIFTLYIWFSTDAFIWWSKLFRLGKKFKIVEWENYRMTVNPKVKYHDFIFQNNPNFLTKLISCKPCFTLWVTLAFIVIFSKSVISLPIYYLISYLGYKKILDKDGI